MAKAGVGDILRFLFRKQLAQEAGDRSDGDLLKQFAATREDRPFTVLFERHAPMVMGVCKRILGDFHQAEDSLQATFHILARRAGSVRWRECLGPWLYAVARRVALRARAKRLAQQNLERRLANMPPSATIDDAAWNDLSSVLDEEIGRLPAKYRAPLILTYLESKSRSRVAKELGWPEGTVARRLERARELLRLRLVKRGVTLSAGALGVALVEKVAAAPVPTMLAINTIKAATTVVAGQAAGGGFISAQALILAEETMKGMLFVKAKLVLLALTVSVALGGAGWAGYERLSKKRQSGPIAMAQAPAVEKQAEPAKEEKVVATDQYGDPLPEGAVARLGALRFRHEGHADGIAYSADGKSLIGLTDSGIILWDAATGKERNRLPLSRVNESPDSPRTLVVSSDGKTVAMPDSHPRFDGLSIVLWDLARGKKNRTLSIPKKEGIGSWDIGSLLFTPDGKKLVLSILEQDKHWRGIIYDLQLDEVHSIIGDADTQFHEFAISPNSKSIAAFNPKANKVLLWDLATGKVIRVLYEGAQDLTITGLEFSPDGKNVAIGVYSQVLIVNAETGTEAIKMEKLKMGPIGKLAFTPDGKKVISLHFSTPALSDGIARAWDLATGKLSQTLGETSWFLYSMAVAPDGQTVVVGTCRNILRFLDLNTGKEKSLGIQGNEGPVVDLAFSRDGKTLASSFGSLGDIQLWDNTDWRHKRSLPEKGSLLAFSPDGKKLATTVYDSRKNCYDKISIWDVSLGNETGVITFPEKNSFYSSPFFSPDGKKLFTLDWMARDQEEIFSVRHWDVASGQQDRQWPIPAQNDLQPSLKPDGKTVFGMLNDGGYFIYDVLSGRSQIRSGQEPQREDGAPASFSRSLSSDSRVFAFAKQVQNPDIRLLEVLTGKEIYVLKGRQGIVSRMAWSTDGRFLATGDRRNYLPTTDQTVQLWDLASGKEVACFDGFKVDVEALEFSPDGKSLATGLRDGTILIFDLTKIKAKSAPPSIVENEKLKIQWGELADNNASKAFQAVWDFIVASKQAIPFLQGRLKPTPIADQGKIQKWIADLDSETFTVRQAAAQELLKVGDQVQPPIQKALQGNPPLETRRRLEQILKNFADIPGPETIRTIRAIMALERIGSPEAQVILETLARGAPGARETEEARASLERLTMRAAKVP